MFNRKIIFIIYFISDRPVVLPMYMFGISLASIIIIIAAALSLLACFASASAWYIVKRRKQYTAVPTAKKAAVIITNLEESDQNELHESCPNLPQKLPTKQAAEKTEALQGPMENKHKTPTGGVFIEPGPHGFTRKPNETQGTYLGPGIRICPKVTNNDQE